MSAAQIDNEALLAFAEAVKLNNIDALEPLLMSTGEYEIINEEDAAIMVTKELFIEWMINIRRGIYEMEYELDECTGCLVGNPVLLFNKGKFPYKSTLTMSHEKTGVALVIKSGIIHTIKFCPNLKNSENKRNVHKKFELIKKFAEANDCSEHYAYMVLGMLGEIENHDNTNYDSL